MKLSSILFEGFREDVSIINGKKYVTDWLGNADTLLDFTRANNMLSIKSGPGKYPNFMENH